MDIKRENPTSSDSLNVVNYSSRLYLSNVVNSFQVSTVKASVLKATTIFEIASPNLHTNSLWASTGLSLSLSVPIPVVYFCDTAMASTFICAFVVVFVLQPATASPIDGLLAPILSPVIGFDFTPFLLCFLVLNFLSYIFSAIGFFGF